MLDYLSSEWLEAASVAFARVVLDPPLEGSLSIAQTVTGAPAGVVRYLITIEGSSVALQSFDPSDELDPSDAVDASDAISPAEPDASRPILQAKSSDIRFTQDYATAAAIAQGQQSAQRAFMQGMLQVGGDITRMISCSTALDAVGDALATLRAQTSF